MLGCFIWNVFTQKGAFKLRHQSNFTSCGLLSTLIKYPSVGATFSFNLALDHDILHSGTHKNLRKQLSMVNYWWIQNNNFLTTKVLPHFSRNWAFLFFCLSSFIFYFYLFIIGGGGGRRLVESRWGSVKSSGVRVEGESMKYFCGKMGGLGKIMWRPVLRHCSGPIISLFPPISHGFLTPPEISGNLLRNWNCL